MTAEAPSTVLTDSTVEATATPAEICQDVFDVLYRLAEVTVYASEIPDLTDEFTIILEDKTEQARHLMASYAEQDSSVRFTIHFGNKIAFLLTGTKSETGVVISHLNNYNLQESGQSEDLITRLDQNFRRVLDEVDEVTLMIDEKVFIIDEPTRIVYLLVQARSNSNPNSQVPVVHLKRQAAGSQGY